MSFRLAPKWMTLNDFEQCNGPEFDSFYGRLGQMVEDRPILSATVM